MTITLYEYPPTRSQRVRWTLNELDVPFESVEGLELIGSDELRKVQPLSKVPGFSDSGRNLFESAAICTWLADSHPEKGLVAPSGTWERALHDQWTSFLLTEIEAYLWSTFRNTVLYPEDARVPAIVEQNGREAKKALAVVDNHLQNTDYLVSNKFTVVDILGGHIVNWSRQNELTEGLAAVHAYVDRLIERPHSTLAKD